MLTVCPLVHWCLARSNAGELRPVHRHGRHLPLTPVVVVSGEDVQQAVADPGVDHREDLVPPGPADALGDHVEQ